MTAESTASRPAVARSRPTGAVRSRPGVSSSASAASATGSATPRRSRSHSSMRSELALVECMPDMAVDRLHVGERHTTEQLEALVRDRDDGAAAVFGVVRLRHEATGGEAVDQPADAGLRDEHRAVQLLQAKTPTRRTGDVEEHVVLVERDDLAGELRRKRPKNRDLRTEERLPCGDRDRAIRHPRLPSTC